MTAKTEQQQGREELFDEMQRMFDSACAGVRTEAITGNAVKEAFWRGQRCTALCALLLATQTSALAEQQQGREGELRTEGEFPTNADLDWMEVAIQRHTGGFEEWWNQNKNELSGREWLKIIISVWEAGRGAKAPTEKGE